MIWSEINLHIERSITTRLWYWFSLKCICGEGGRSRPSLAPTTPAHDPQGCGECKKDCTEQSLPMCNGILTLFSGSNPDFAFSIDGSQTHLLKMAEKESSQSKSNFIQYCPVSPLSKPFLAIYASNIIRCNVLKSLYKPCIGPYIGFCHGKEHPQGNSDESSEAF